MHSRNAIDSDPVNEHVISLDLTKKIDIFKRLIRYVRQT